MKADAENAKNPEKFEGLPCPHCGSRNSRVLRPDHYATFTRRRRECHDCGKRFWSRESVEAVENGQNAMSSGERIGQILGLLRQAENLSVQERLARLESQEETTP